MVLKNTTAKPKKRIRPRSGPYHENHVFVVNPNHIAIFANILKFMNNKSLRVLIMEKTYNTVQHNNHTILHILWWTGNNSADTNVIHEDET
ncbi:Hypothetical predicted protein [Octopus vulgaris]|uniref:Uncharacterized protein n=1 Tax=Octopus vulgaris TaxID=6645 RepID=A0AA36AUC5_OCTVU|nr:Hypothetical predicted protein [Octopus vulgaris]